MVPTRLQSRLFGLDTASSQLSPDGICGLVMPAPSGVDRRGLSGDVEHWIVVEVDVVGRANAGGAATLQSVRRNAIMSRRCLAERPSPKG